MIALQSAVWLLCSRLCGCYAVCCVVAMLSMPSPGPDVSLQLRNGLSAGLPLVRPSLALLHYIALDVGAPIVLGGLPEQEDALGTLISPLQVLWGIGYSWTHRIARLPDVSHLEETPLH